MLIVSQLADSYRQKNSPLIIVGGGAPPALSFPRELLKKHFVIGLNYWYQHYDDYDCILAADTGLMYLDEKTRKELSELKCPVLLRRPNTTEFERNIPDDYAFWFDSDGTISPLRDQENGKFWLKLISTSAVPAIHLAVLLGAKEIILWGVDLIGNESIGGRVYEPDRGRKDVWEPHIQSVNYALSLFKSSCKIYKTNKDSPLDCEFLEIV